MKRLIGFIWAENPRPSSANLAVVAFAQQYARSANAPFDLIIAGGPDAEASAQEYAHYGAEKVVVASQTELGRATPQAIAEACVGVWMRAPESSLAGPATQFGSDTLASVAGLLGLPMLPPLCAIDEIEGQRVFHSIQGSRREVIRIDADRAIFPIARTAFGAPEKTREASPLEPVPDTLKFYAEVESQDVIPISSQPSDLAAARVVVAGGRALGDAQTFDRLVGGLARKLNGMLAASGAAVQAGIAPKELLIGQTGQTVSPDLYIAAGISGSDQHTGGMSESRVVVAINSNPNATIFRIADYSLVADVHQALPELIEKL